MASCATPGECGQGEGREGEGKPDFEVAVVGGDRYESLEMAQQAALGPLADALAAGIRSALAEGALIVVDGVVVLPEDEADE